MGLRLPSVAALSAAVAAFVGGCAPDLRLSPEPGSGGSGGGAVTSSSSTTGTAGAGGEDSNSGEPLWASWITGSGDETARALHRQGNQLILAAEFTGSLDVGGLASAGSTDVAWVRLTEGGTPVQAARLGGLNPQRVHALFTDSAGASLVAGDFSGSVGGGTKQANTSGGLDGYVARLDGSGAAIWIRSLGGTGHDTCAAVGADAMGNVLVAGSFTGSLNADTTSAGGEDAFVAKLSATGAVSWIVPLGDGKSQRARAIVVDGSGNAVVLAEIEGTMEIGATLLASQGQTDIALLKLDESGTLLWARRFGTAGADTASRLLLDQDGNILVTGSFAGSLDLGSGPISGQAFVAKLDPEGNPVHSRGFASEDPFSLDAIAVDSKGATVVTGTFSGKLDVGPEVLESAGGEDLFVVKMSPAWEVEWARAHGGPDAERAAAIVIAGNSVIVAGSFLGETVLGTEALGPSQGEDLFLLALKP